MLVDCEGRFLSQRRLPRMALISASLTAEALLLEAPGMSTLALPLQPAPDELGARLPVRVFDDVTEGAAAGAEADRWFGEFSRSRVPTRLHVGRRGAVGGYALRAGR
jgi:uncharacterized protein